MAERDRLEVPPPGPRLPFEQWARLIVTDVRQIIPDATAVARRDGAVLIRRGELTAAIREDGENRWVTFAGSSMASLNDSERHDAFTAHNIAISIAGFLDAGASRLGR